MNLCLQGIGDLHICSSQTGKNIAQILLFPDYLLLFYQAFGMFGLNLAFNRGGIICLLLRGLCFCQTYLVCI